MSTWWRSRSRADAISRRRGRSRCSTPLQLHSASRMIDSFSMTSAMRDGGSSGLSRTESKADRTGRREGRGEHPPAKPQREPADGQQPGVDREASAAFEGRECDAEAHAGEDAQRTPAARPAEGSGPLSNGLPGASAGVVNAASPPRVGRGAAGTSMLERRHRAHACRSARRRWTDSTATPRISGVTGCSLNRATW